MKEINFQIMIHGIYQNIKQKKLTKKEKENPNSISKQMVSR
jgi:hypothetical protein